MRMQWRAAPALFDDNRIINSVEEMMATVTLKGNPVNVGGSLPAKGDKAPDFCLVSHLGNRICLADYQGEKNVLIAFFPLSWTPI